MFSTMLLLHQGLPNDEISSVAPHSLVVDPTMEETQNLSHNLVLVTVIKQAASEDMEVDWDADNGSEDGDTLIIEKVSEPLRTCYSC